MSTAVVPAFACGVLLEVTRLSVDIAAMANSKDIYQAVAVRNPVNHAPLADADAPKIRGTLKLDDSGWARVGHKHFDLLDDPSRNLWIEVLQFLAR